MVYYFFCTFVETILIMEREKLIHQLFIGKVADIIGMDKTTELLKEVYDDVKLHQPTVIGTLPLCNSCGKGKSFDINYNCFDCGKPF